MTKTFCDKCEEPAIDLSKKRELILNWRVPGNKTAQISVWISLGIATRSTGSHPDLCNRCFLEIIDELKKHAMKEEKK